jgi:hypothetical protein
VYSYSVVDVNGVRVADQHYRPLDYNDLYYNEMKREAIYLFVSAGVVILFSFLLLCVYCCNCYCLGPKARHILVVFVIIVELAVGVVMLLRFCSNDDLNDNSVQPLYGSLYQPSFPLSATVNLYNAPQNGWKGTPTLTQTNSTILPPTTGSPWSTSSSPSRSPWCSSCASSGRPSTKSSTTKSSPRSWSKSLPSAIVSSDNLLFYALISN